jgi:hypothetical protein
MHSSDQAYRVRGGTVYHIDGRCPWGRQIPEDLLVRNRGGLPLCPTCRARTEAKPPSGPFPQVSVPAEAESGDGEPRRRRRDE